MLIAVQRDCVLILAPAKGLWVSEIPPALPWIREHWARRVEGRCGKPWVPSWARAGLITGDDEIAGCKLVFPSHGANGAQGNIEYL